MNFIKKLFEKYREIIMYLIFGVSTTLVSFISYSVFVEIIHLDVTVSNALSWVLAVTFAFITNKLFVFNSKANEFKAVIYELITFFGARIFSGLFEIFLPAPLIALGLDQKPFGVEGLMAKFVVAIIVIILNYILSKLIVFRKRK